MATVRSSTSSTIVSLLGTVNSAASIITKTADSVASSVDMLDRYVQRAKTKQATAHAIEDAHWTRNLIIDAAHEQEKKETQLAKDYEGDKPRQDRFNAIVADLENILNPKQVGA